MNETKESVERYNELYGKQKDAVEVQRQFMQAIKEYEEYRLKHKPVSSVWDQKENNRHLELLTDILARAPSGRDVRDSFIKGLLAGAMIATVCIAIAIVIFA